MANDYRKEIDKQWCGCGKRKEREAKVVMAFLLRRSYYVSLWNFLVPKETHGKEDGLGSCRLAVSLMVTRTKLFALRRSKI